MRLVGGKLVGDDDTPLDGPMLEEAQTPPPLSTASEYPTCDTCGEPNYEWQPGTRGRKPKYHADCRPVSPNRTGSTSPRRTTTLRNENALREALTGRYLLLAQIAQWRHPAYAEGIRDKVDRAVEADIAYAKVNPGFRKALESILAKSAAGEVIAVHLAMFAPVIVGEAASRGRKKAEQPARGRQEAKPETSRQSTQPPPQPSPRPDNVTRIRPDMPGEHETVNAETVNAAAMDGMPGGI